MLLKGFKTRIAVERAVMAKQMPQFNFYQGYERFFQGWYKTSVENKSYLLKLAIPDNFPDQMPQLFVIFPETLPLSFLAGSLQIVDGQLKFGTVNALGCTHNFHTLDNGPGGCVQICHFSSESWDASKTCVSVMIKGVLWCEAYDVHRDTGMDISTIVDQFKRRQEWKMNSNALGKSSLTWLEEMMSDTKWFSIPEQNQYEQYPIMNGTLTRLLK